MCYNSKGTLQCYYRETSSTVTDPDIGLGADQLRLENHHTPNRSQIPPMMLDALSHVVSNYDPVEVYPPIRWGSRPIQTIN